MVKRVFLVLLVGVVGCFLDAPQVSDAGQGAMPLKHCELPNARYHVQFTPVSGDCNPNFSEGWVTSGPDGHTMLPYWCSDLSVYGACTTFQSEYCHTWTTNQQFTGQLSWSPNGTFASGTLTLVAFNIADGSLNCSSQYFTTYTYEYSFEP